MVEGLSPLAVSTCLVGKKAMSRFALDEVEAAFRVYWQTGIVCEEWNAWVDLFTEDVAYYERIYGTMHGREAVRNWLVPLMKKYTGVYGVYDWHHADESGRVVFRMQNRTDLDVHDSFIDFPGMTVLQYAGHGQWSEEEDYWAPTMAKEAFVAYGKAVKKDPLFGKKKSRLHWGNGPAWTRGKSSFEERPTLSERLP
jgi:hypothetical protein